MADLYVDHAIDGLDAAYKRFDTMNARQEIALRYSDLMTTEISTKPDLDIPQYRWNLILIC